MGKNIILLGGGGHCESVADSLLSEGEYNKIGIVMNENQIPLFGEIPVIGANDDLPELRKSGYEFPDIFIV